MSPAVAGNRWEKVWRLSGFTNMALARRKQEMPPMSRHTPPPTTMFYPAARRPAHASAAIVFRHLLLLSYVVFRHLFFFTMLLFLSRLFTPACAMRALVFADARHLSPVGGRGRPARVIIFRGVCRPESRRSRRRRLMPLSPPALPVEPPSVRRRLPPPAKPPDRYHYCHTARRAMRGGRQRR